VKTIPSPSAPAKKPVKPQTAPDKVAQPFTPPGTKRFTIQVAAVKNTQNAEKLVLDLRRKGFDAYQISSRSNDGTTWYRVRVGAFQDRSEAQSILDRLSKNQINGMVLRTP
jgi:cell division septation protein DedD